METFKVLTLVGGISQGSINKKLFRYIQSQDYQDFQFEFFDISRLPYFSQDLENDPPDSVTELKELIRHVDAVLFITPEYNRSVPGVLKNAIDWGSRPYGQNLWANLPAAIMGASVGSIGTFGAQHHLRQIVSYLDMVAMNQPEFYLNFSRAFKEDGQPNDDSVKKLISNFFESFSEWIKQHGKQEVLVSSRGKKPEDLLGIQH